MKLKTRSGFKRVGFIWLPGVLEGMKSNINQINGEKLLRATVSSGYFGCNL